MATDQFDPDRFKAGQQQTWDSVAAGWKLWCATFEDGAGALSSHLASLAGVRAGYRVLDIATGIGEPAITAAALVGTSGHVVAIDQAPQMLAIARERAQGLGLNNLDFREMDAEKLELPQETFQAVLCRWGLMFLPNLADSLISMRRLLTPGGKLAAAVWSTPDKVPLLSIAANVVRQMVEMPPPPPGTPNAFNLADAPKLEQALTQAGFADVRSEPFTVTFTFASGEEFSRFILDVGGPVAEVVRTQPADKQTEMINGMLEAVQQFVTPEGKLSIPNEVVCVVGAQSS